MEPGDVMFRAVFTDWERSINFEDVHRLLERVEALVWVAVVNDRMMRHDPLERRKQAHRIVDAQTVHSIKYASPFEIVFSITAATGAVSGAGIGLLTLWNKYQDARMKKASADTYVSAQHIIRDHLELESTQAHDIQQVDLAANALNMLTLLEPVEQQMEA